MAGPSPFEAAKMNSPALSGGELVVTRNADGSSTLERVEKTPSRAWRIVRVALVVLAVAALALVLVMPALVQ